MNCSVRESHPVWNAQINKDHAPKSVVSPPPPNEMCMCVFWAEC